MSVFGAVPVRMAWEVLEKLGITREKVEATKTEFLGWLERNGKKPKWSSYQAFKKDWDAFRKDVAGESSLTDWILGLIIAAILGVGVAVPIVIQTVQTALANATGITATVIGVIPVAVAIALLLVFLGRR